jgi:glycosyltransferase involved in cell wall biosynthesis
MLRDSRAPSRERRLQELGLPADRPIVASVGRLVARKGVVWFIENVLPAMRSPICYVVVGDGPDGDAVAAAAARGPQVQFLGRLPARAIDRLYSVADLFVAPNIVVPGKPEGYGIAPAEAAAAGLPVLVSNIEGLADMAAETGIPTVPAGDTRAWAAAIEAALANPGSARAAARPRSWVTVANDYARFFEGVASNSGRRLNAAPR